MLNSKLTENTNKEVTKPLIGRNNKTNPTTLSIDNVINLLKINIHCISKDEN